MQVPVLATKLHAPPPRPGLVLRPGLVERLNQGLTGRLTLICAPAGFGKTTLAAEWVACRGRPAAWLSLDEADGDPSRFLAYLVAALQAVVPAVGKTALAALRSSPQQPAEHVLGPLINEISAHRAELVLVLDDYHAVDARSIDEALAFLVEHSPPRMHLVICTREDPNLPLARWRARGQVTELRAADLRFTAAEASLFLEQAMGLRLSEGDVEALEERTEGWIAGLQMAALSLRGRADAAGFIREFSGSHRFVFDYLLQEVLERQPQDVRDFLLQTSILDGLNGALCDAATGRADGAALLEALERANLFLVPLDDQRRWYRYHHLFAHVLRARLREALPGRLALLHRRAGVWYEQNGMPFEAIPHLFAAGDLERVAALLQQEVSVLEGSPHASAWMRWVRELPDEVVRARPVLSAWYGYGLLGRAELEAAESRLRDAEQWLAAPPPEKAAGSEEQLRSLPATIGIARAFLSLAHGDVPCTVRHARQVLDLRPEADLVRRDQASGLLGLASWASGDLETAGRVFEDYSARLRSAGNVPDAIGTAAVLADIRIAQGLLGDAQRVAEQSLRFVADQGEPLAPDAADLFRALGEACRERGDLDAAARHLAKASDLVAQAALMGLPQRLCVAQALLAQTRGDLDGALDLLAKAERLQVRTPLPVVRPVGAMRARIRVVHGRQAEALAWARAQGLSADDEPSYLREYEHITLARALLAAQPGEDGGGALAADGLLGRLLEAAEGGQRLGSVIEVLVLRALAREALGDTAAALASLEQAVSLARVEGHALALAQAGAALAGLMRKARALAPGASAPAVRLPSPLSEREHEVMRMLATDLKGPDIARELFISLNTLRTHTKNIFGKLGVDNRRAAVRHARELGLL